MISNVTHRYSLIRLSALKAQILTVVFICLTWVFFRADSLDTALTVLYQMTKIEGTFTRNHLLLILMSIAFFYFSQRAQLIEDKMISWANRNWGWRLFLVASAILFLIIYTGPNGIPTFIYYKF